MAVRRDRPVRPGEPKPPKAKYPAGPKSPAPGKPRPPKFPTPGKPRPTPKGILTLGQRRALRQYATVGTDTKSPAERAGRSQAWRVERRSVAGVYRPEPRRGYSSRQPSARRGMR